MLDHATGPDLPQALRHERALRRLAAALLRDPTDVDDAVQHALAQEGLGRRRPGTPLLPFLRATVRRCASNLRTLARRRLRRERAAARPEALPSAMEIAAREQLRRRVADAVQALDEPYRTAVWLRWFEDLDAHEVAARMAVPVATVRTRLQRANAQLRQRLDRDYGDRAAWAAAALPLLPAASVLIATGLTMKKLLAAVVAVAVCLCGYALWPAAPQPRSVGERGTGVAVATAPGASGNAATERELVRAADAGASAAAALPQLRVVYADGSPARGLSVLFWRADDRPRWTQRVDDRRDGTMGPGVANAYSEPAPPATTLETDGNGSVAWPAGEGAVAAVSVQFADQQWFSAAPPRDPAPLVLPALGELELGLRSAPAGASWEVDVTPGFRGHDVDVVDYLATQLRANLVTASGEGVVRLRSQHLRLPASERVRLVVLRGNRYGVDAWGHGFELRRVSAEDQVVAPAVVEFAVVGALPRVEVRVLDAGGGATSAAGRAHLCNEATTQQDHELQQGVAVFDEVRLPGDVPHPLDVLMADGEWFHRDLAGTGSQSVVFTRGEGARGMRIRLPGLERAADIAHAFVESVSGRLRDCDGPGLLGFYEPSAKLVFAAGAVIVHALPADAATVWILARDGRVAAVPGVADAAVDAQWLPADPIAPIDVAGLYRDHGDLPIMSALVATRITGSHGEERWWNFASHLRSPRQEFPEPPPVWSGLQAPRGLRTRLLVSGRGSPDESEPRIEREYELPRR
jgi:RNA polymerase sigma-70 factor (ECF subfamily)